MTKNERDTRILALFDAGEMIYEDIAAEVGCSRGTVFNVVRANRGNPPQRQAVEPQFDKRLANTARAYSLHVQGAPLDEISKTLNIPNLDTVRRYVDEGRDHVLALAARLATSQKPISIRTYPPDAFPSVETVLSYKTTAAPHRGAISWSREDKFICPWYGPWRSTPEQALSDAFAEIRRDGHPVEATG